MDGKLKKRIISFSLSTLALAAVVIGMIVIGLSTAWLASNDSVTASEMSVLVNTSGPVAVTVDVFNVRQDDGRIGDTLYFGSTKINIGDDKVTMPRYELLNDMNRYLLMRINIGEGAEGETMRLTANTSSSYFMDSDHPLLKGNGTVEKCTKCDPSHDYSNSLASIVSFAVFDESEITAADSDYSLSLSEKELQSLAVMDEESKKMTMLPSVTLADNIDGNTVDVLYVLIAYDTEKINRVYSQNIGGAAFTPDEITGLIDDIVFIADIEFYLEIKR